MLSIPFENQYATLGEGFFARTRPTPVSAPVLIRFNHELAAKMKMAFAGLDDDRLAQLFSGNEIPEGAEPLAMAYAGHQFGFYSPQLGDGRAILLGELSGQNGQRYEIQLKGSGRTVYSRHGDGRAPLGPVLREYLVSEAMHHLGVPTTRALAAVVTGDQVFREQALPGAVLTRVASSFVRVGTFEFHARRSDRAGVVKLADYMIRHNFPALAEADNPYLALLEKAVELQAVLIAKWMQLGFVHGVMNTDNMSILGETIDYGPCAFMDRFAFDRVFSSIDEMGRYAYSNQPRIALWNLTRLAECLALAINADLNAAVEAARQVLEKFESLYEKAWLEGMRTKCGFSGEHDKTASRERSLVAELLSLMHENAADFSQTFYELSRLSNQPNDKDRKFLGQFPANRQAIEQWLVKWRAVLALKGLDESTRQSQMQSVNPVYIPRSHMIEQAIQDAEKHGDFSAFHALHEVLKTPYARQRGMQRFQSSPAPEQEVRKTFCGT